MSKIINVIIILFFLSLVYTGLTTFVAVLYWIIATITLVGGIMVLVATLDTGEMHKDIKMLFNDNKWKILMLDWICASIIHIAIAFFLLHSMSITIVLSIALILRITTTFVLERRCRVKI